MHKVDSFFVVILLIIAGLVVTYKSAQYDLSELQLLVKMNRQLVYENKILALKNKELEIKWAQFSDGGIGKMNTRFPASQSTNEDWIAPEKQAQSIFNKIKNECLVKQNSECVHQVDLLITQFPDTTWAGRGLVYLAKFYNENRKKSQAEEVIFVVNQEFKKDKEVMLLKNKLLTVE